MDDSAVAQPSARPYGPALVVTLLGSVLLSLAAIHYSPILDRDGMLYINVAELIGDGHLDQALALFDWPFYSAFMAALEAVLPVSMSHVAYAVSVVFAALASWMLVLLLHRLTPDKSIWWAVLTALSFSAFNEYRPGVLRDWPAWFFMLLSIWLYLRYSQSRAWSWAVCFFLAVLIGALFRLETGVILVPLFLLSLFERGARWRDRLRLFVIPIVIGALGVGVLLSDSDGLSRRLWGYLNTINPALIYEGFIRSGDALADAVLNQFSEDYGAAVLLFGLLILIPIKLLHYLFAMMLPGILARRHGSLRFDGDLRVYGTLALTWLAVVVLFLWRHYFLSTRYLVPLMVCLLPFLYVGMMRLTEHRVRGWVWGILIFLILLQGLSGAISTRGQEKLAIREAGEWARENLPSDERVYINNGQINFYSGRPYFRGDSDKIRPPEQVDSRWQVLMVDRDEEVTTKDKLEQRYRLIQRFDTGGSDLVLVFEKRVQYGERRPSG